MSTTKESPQLIKVESQWFMEEFPNHANFGPFQIVNYSKLNQWCSQRKAKVSQQPFSSSHEIYICFGSSQFAFKFPNGISSDVPKPFSRKCIYGARLFVCL
jgi:hypothetical protein